MALTDFQGALGDQTLHVDHFGLAIGMVSVGLPMACTPDDVYRRYLDLRRIMARGPIEFFEAPTDDLRALSDATSADPAFVAQRLRVLQAG